MEAVEEVEFTRDLVSDTTRNAIFVKGFFDLDAGVEGPARFNTIDVGDGTDVAVGI